MEHFFRLYGRRNRIFLPSLGKRRLFLHLAVSDLHQAIRKERRSDSFDVVLARIVSRIFCIAEHFWSLPFVECLARKYPATHCAYCQRLPCACPERRPDAQLLPVPPTQQLVWTLRDWTLCFNALYGERNRQRGIDNLMNRLFRELGELASVHIRLPQTGQTLDAIEEAFALELADIFAWTIAIANYLNRDLERAVLDRFGAGCWNCRQNPCICTEFNYQLMEW